MEGRSERKRAESVVGRAGRACARLWWALDRPVAGRATRSRRGIALILVLTYIAVMSATVISSFMNSQVSFMISSNVRDDLKAYYKAKSALNLGRLMLTYQYELEADEFFGQRIRRSNFQMYSILDLLMTPFKTGVIAVDVPNANRTIASYDLKGAGVDAMGDENGDYEVRVEPEAGKLNINKFADIAAPIEEKTDQRLYDFCLMMQNKQFDDLFDVSTKDEYLPGRMEVLASLVDWVDPDSERTYITDECVWQPPGGDESGQYKDTRKKYEVKNDKFTTLDEMYEVAGWGDDLMEAFRDTITVYPVEKINVNLASAKVLYSTLCNSVQTDSGSGGNDNRLWACADQTVGSELLIVAMALEGYQQFVSNPMNLLYLYTVENETSVIPGVVGNGTIVPFKDIPEFYRVLQAMIKGTDQSTGSELISKFLMYSPTAYLMFGEKIVEVARTPIGVSNLTFDTKQLYPNITVASPRIFRMTAVGEYAGTKRTLSAVVDFNTKGGKFLYWREY